MRFAVLAVQLLERATTVPSGGARALRHMSIVQAASSARRSSRATEPVQHYDARPAASVRDREAVRAQLTVAQSGRAAAAASALVVAGQTTTEAVVEAETSMPLSTVAELDARLALAQGTHSALLERRSQLTVEFHRQLAELEAEINESGRALEAAQLARAVLEEPPLPTRPRRASSAEVDYSKAGSGTQQQKRGRTRADGSGGQSSGKSGQTAHGARKAARLAEGAAKPSSAAELYRAMTSERAFGLVKEPGINSGLPLHQAIWWEPRVQWSTWLDQMRQCLPQVVALHQMWPIPQPRRCEAFRTLQSWNWTSKWQSAKEAHERGQLERGSCHQEDLL